MKTALLVVNSEKSVPAVTGNVRLIEETTIPVEEMIKNEAIGFVHLAVTIILLSELNATVVVNQSEVTFRNVAVLSETIVVGEGVTTVADAEMTVVEEGATTEDLVIKNNIIEMTGFALHVRMTTFLSEPNATNVGSLDREETLVEEIPAEVTVEDVEATEEVAPAADEMVIVEDVEATEEVASVADETVIVEDVEATEEVASAADETVIVEEVKVDVEMTEAVVEEMTVQTKSIAKLVESDLAMLTIDHLKKSSPVDINDAITMIIKVKL